MSLWFLLNTPSDACTQQQGSSALCISFDVSTSTTLWMHVQGDYFDFSHLTDRPVGSIMVLWHRQLILGILWKGFGDLIGGSCSTGKLFCCHLALLCIYWSSAISHATLTHCKSMLLLLIVLFTSLLCLSSLLPAFSPPTLTTCFSTMPNTSTPCPKTIIQFHMSRASSDVLCSVCMLFPSILTCFHCSWHFSVLILSPIGEFWALGLIWHVLMFLLMFSGRLHHSACSWKWSTYLQHFSSHPPHLCTSSLHW